MKTEDYVKFDINDPMIKGHSAPIAAFQFNPFIDNLLATASEDGSVAIWTIPIEGLKEDIKTPNATLYGHSKKLTHLTFNPSAENVFATASFDKCVKIWDGYQGKEILSVDGIIGQPTCLEWNYDGSLIASVDKSKNLHVFDPRDTTTAAFGGPAHEGPKQQKCCWLGESNRILTTGVSKQLFKEVCVWDSRDMSKPLTRKSAEKNIEVSDPFFDSSNNLVYLAVKGEARVNVWELTDDDDLIHPVASYKGEGSHRGFNFFPKRCVDVMSSELMRGIRLTDKFLEYVSFRLPKKRGCFVPTLYKDCPSGEFSKTLDQWTSGENAPAHTVKINPDLGASLKLRVHDGSVLVNEDVEEVKKDLQIVEVSASSSAGNTSAAVGSSVQSVNESNSDEIKKNYERKITELEDQLKDKDAADHSSSHDNTEEVESLKTENTQLNSKVTELETKVSQLEITSKDKDQQIEELKQVRI